MNGLFYYSNVGDIELKKLVKRLTERIPRKLKKLLKSESRIKLKPKIVPAPDGVLVKITSKPESEWSKKFEERRDHWTKISLARWKTKK